MVRKDHVDMPLEPWHMQPGESARAFAAFSVYRDLGPGRSIQKACEKQSAAVPPPSSHSKQAHQASALATMKEWSAEFHWVERAKAYDQHLDEQRTAATMEQWKANSQAACDLVWKALAIYADKPGEIGSHDLPHLIREASKLSFLLSGTPTERLKQEVQATVQDESQQANAAFLSLFAQLTNSAPSNQPDALPSTADEGEGEG